MSSDESSIGIDFCYSTDECAICLEELTDAPTQPLLCNHVFHTNCIHLLRIYSVFGEDYISCPICRTINHIPHRDIRRSCRRCCKIWYYRITGAYDNGFCTVLGAFIVLLFLAVVNMVVNT